MDFHLIATLATGALVLVGLVLLSAQIRALAHASATYSIRRSGAAPAPDRPATDALDGRLDRIETRLGHLYALLEEQESLLRSLSPRTALAEAPSSAPVPLLPVTAAPPPQTYTEPVPGPREAAAPSPVPPSAPAQRQDHTALLTDYRRLIAQPIKTEINRWTDEHGGLSCEALDDGIFEPISREAGAMLVLLPAEGDRALVVPGGRLVAEFATNFANAFSMRNITRGAFEPVSDGSGVLRLIEPALAELREDRWRLVQPGRLGGFTSA